MQFENGPKITKVNEKQHSSALTSSSDTQAEINTDLPENRLKRAINHYQFEQETLPKTFGLSFKDRFLITRASLFKGFSNISGEDYVRLLREGKVLSDSRAQISDSFMPNNEAAEIALEAYMQMVDGWYQKITDMPEGEDKEEAVFRMIAALFVCGVLIHPARDGNGQTFKGIVLSYLHDLLPAKKDFFIPIKYDIEHHNLGHEMAISFMGGGGHVVMEDDLTGGRVPRIEPKSERDKRLLDFIAQIKKIENDTQYLLGESFAERDRKREEAYGKLVEEAGDELQLSDYFKSEIVTYEDRRRLLFFRKKIPKYESLITTFRRGCINYLKTQGYPIEQIDVTVRGSSGQKIDRASFAVRQLMGTDSGRKVLTDYVITGGATIGEEDTPANILFKKAVKMIGRQKENIKKTLESKGEHDQRHKEMLNLLS